MVVTRKGDWLFSRVDDELVMMSADKGNYLGLSEVGARIWELIEVPMSLEDLCARLLGEFEVEAETCQREVETFLAELAKHDAVAFDPVPAA